MHGTCLSRIILGNLDRQNEIDKQEFKVTFRKPLCLPATVQIRRKEIDGRVRFTAADAKDSIY